MPRKHEEKWLQFVLVLLPWVGFKCGVLSPEKANVKLFASICSGFTDLIYLLPYRFICQEDGNDLTCILSRTNSVSRCRNVHLNIKVFVSWDIEKYSTVGVYEADKAAGVGLCEWMKAVVLLALCTLGSKPGKCWHSSRSCRAWGICCFWSQTNFYQTGVHKKFFLFRINLRSQSLTLGGED